MDIDPDDVFRDEDEENEIYEERYASKEMLVYLVDASPKMFSFTCQAEDNKDMSHFEITLYSIGQSLKTQIINRSYDEVAICFFNTREKKNLQDLNGVYVYNVPERQDLDRPTASLIKEFDWIVGYILDLVLTDKFSNQVGSKYGTLPDTRDNSLYNALWVAQGLLRKGSAKRVDKRIMLFTNEDDPFGNIKGVTKMDMMRTTLQRAQDARDMGISIELLPLSRPQNDFNLSTFYAELLGLEENDLAEFKLLAGERFVDMNDQLRKRIFRKRKVRRIEFIIAGGLSIELNTYALVRPTNPGTITWLDSVTNLPVKVERSFFCSDTGAQLQVPPKLFQTYKNQSILFSSNEISEIKRVSAEHLHLLGFKPLSCLKDYHNISRSTFVFPSDEEVIGSTSVFIALHRSMLRLGRFAVAFSGGSTHQQLVALVAQDEIVSNSGQVEPPGMYMIYLPFSDDIRPVEEFHTDSNPVVARAIEDQVKSASSLVKRVDLKEFSVCQFANPGKIPYFERVLCSTSNMGDIRHYRRANISALQRHYAVLQALALGEDEMPDIKDETLPDEVGLARPGIVKALEDFKLSVYGQNFEQDKDIMDSDKRVKGSRKRKGDADVAIKEYINYDWPVLADNGKLKDLTVVELKYYLAANSLPVTGKKEALISRILTHMRK